jgi:hypothetical protein
VTKRLHRYCGTPICTLLQAVVSAANRNWVRRVKLQEWALKINCRQVQSFAEIENPLIRKVRE